MKKNDIDLLKGFSWITTNKGTLSFLSCTDWISCWTTDVKVEGEHPIQHPMQICSMGKSETWFPKKELDLFGERINHFATLKNVALLVGKTKETGEDLSFFIKKHQETKFNTILYRELWDKIGQYYQWHLIVKYLPDYASAEFLKDHLETLQDLRVQYAEPVGKAIFQILDKVVADVSASLSMELELVKCFTRDELSVYFDSGVVPERILLEERYKKAIVIGVEGGYIFITGEECKEIESFINKKDINEISGVSAYKGVVRGVAKVVLDPQEDVDFQEGDILIAGMTRVEYLPLVKKAAALVTDAGGILSHAAIIARELKKPCVIGTADATKIIKSGDMLEVDANNGVIRIIN